MRGGRVGEWLARVATPWRIVLAVALVYSLHSGSRVYRMITAGFDLGIFDQAVRGYAHFRPPIVSLKGVDYNLLGDHWHPILALLAPLYWVYDRPITLVVAQAVLMALSWWPVYRFACRRMSEGWARATATAYVLGWPMQGMADFDVHEVAFAVPLLAVLVDAIDDWRPRVVAAASALLLLVREDMGIVVACFGVVVLLRGARAALGSDPGPGERGRLAAGAAMVVGGLAAFVLVTSVLLPAINPAGQYAYWDYPALGADARSAVVNSLRDPGHVVHTFLNPGVKRVTLGWLLVPLLLMPLGSLYALPVAPLLASRFLADRETLWAPQFHYNAVIWPILVMAALDTAARASAHLRRERPDLVERARGLTPLRALSCTLIGVTLVGTLVFPPRFYLSYLVTGLDWRVDDHWRARRAMLPHVPQDVCLVSDDRLADELSRTTVVALEPELLPGGRPDLVLVDRTRGPLYTTHPPFPDDVSAWARSRGYELVAQEGQIELWQDPAWVPGARPECVPAWRRPAL